MSTLKIGTVAAYLEAVAPLSLAESWDNVGLLVGDRARPVSKVVTCLSVTVDSAAEAIAAGAELLITHHPLPFKPLKRITTETIEGQLLWSLISAGVSIYSAHTAFDSAGRGINQRLAEGLGLVDVQPFPTPGGIYAGRFGQLETGCTLQQLGERAKTFLNTRPMQWVGNGFRDLQRVGIACGSGGSFLSAAVAANCDCLVTGEARFHTLLEAEQLGISLLLLGHYASERFAMECLATALKEQFPELEVWPSRDEHDPLQFG